MSYCMSCAVHRKLVFPAEDGETTISDGCNAPLLRHKEAKVSKHPQYLTAPSPSLSPYCSWMKMVPLPLRLILTSNSKSIPTNTVTGSQIMPVSTTKNGSTLTSSQQRDTTDTGGDTRDCGDPAASRRRPHPPHSTNTMMVSGS